MNSLLYVRRCSIIPFFKKCTSVASIKSFHLISNETHLLKSYFPVSAQVRTFWECFPRIRPLFYEKDGLSRSQYELIYRSRIFNYAFYGQFLGSLALAAQFFGGIYYAYCSYVAQEVIHAATHIGPIPINYDLPTLVIICGFFIQNCLLLIAAQTAVLRAYYCKDAEKFVIVTLSWNPFKSKLYYCNPGEMFLLKESILNIVFGNHRINHKNVFVKDIGFKTTFYYNKLIGDNFNKTL